MKFSIVIPSARQTQQLVKTLRCLEQQTYRKENFEVIVVRNQVAETDFALFRNLGFKKNHLSVLVTEAVGPSEARNLGIAAAQYNTLIFIDDDCLPGKNWLQQYYLAWKAFPSAAIIGGAVTVVKTVIQPKLRFRLSDHAWCFAITQLGAKSRWLTKHEVVFSANFSLNQQKIPLTKENNFFYPELGRREKFGLLLGEDWELCLRTHVMGGKVAYWPECRVINEISNERVRFSYLLRRYWLAGIERWRAEKHLSGFYSNFIPSYWKEWYYEIHQTSFFSELTVLKFVLLISYTLQRFG